MNPPPAQPNLSIIEGIELLYAVASSNEPVKVRETARKLSITPSRAQRYLATLAHIGLAVRDAERRYSIGPGIHVLSALTLSASGLAKQAVRVLPTLDDLGCIVALGVLWRDTVSYLYHGDSHSTGAEALGRVQSYPAIDSSIGHLLIALGGVEQEKALTVAQRKQIHPLIPLIRKQGYAIIRRSEQDASFAVPVGSPAVAGLALSGQIAKAQEKKVLERLKQAARSLSNPNQENL